MRFVMLIAVMVLLGCDPGERARDAAACPVATTDRVSVTVRFDVIGWDAPVTPLDWFGLSVETETSDDPIFFSDSVKLALEESGSRIPFANLDEMRSTRATVRFLDKSPQSSDTVYDTKTVTLDRNCDLLVEIAQSGDDPPRIDDVRWIPRE